MRQQVIRIKHLLAVMIVGQTWRACVRPSPDHVGPDFDITDYAILALVWIVEIEVALTGSRHLQTDSQVRKQEAECQEVGAWASMRGCLATRGSTSVMNL